MQFSTVSINGFRALIVIQETDEGIIIDRGGVTAELQRIIKQVILLVGFKRDLLYLFGIVLIATFFSDLRDRYDAKLERTAFFIILDHRQTKTEKVKIKDMGVF